jgi:hypothetical protein
MFGDEDGVEEFYHFVVLVFRMAPADQVLGRVMTPVFRFLSCCGVRSMIYVNDGIVVAAEKARADEHYALTIGTFKKAGFTVAEEISDAPGKSAQRKEYVSRFPD